MAINTSPLASLNIFNMYGLECFFFPRTHKHAGPTLVPYTCNVRIQAKLHIG
jgi:hypothetical protein